MECSDSEITEEDVNLPTTPYQKMKYQNDKITLIEHFVSKISVNIIIIVTLLLVCVYLFAKINRLEDDLRIFTNSFQQNSSKLQKYNHLWKNINRNQYNVQKIHKIRELSMKQQFFEEQPIAKAQYLLSINNYPLSFYNKSLAKEILEYEKQVNSRMENIYDYSLPQLPFCIISYSTNNSHNFRNQHSLISILNQKYENYKIVIFDDLSSDDSYFVLQQFISDKNLSSKLVLIKNNQKQRYLKNIYNGVMNYCQQHDIIITVNGDDQLLGNNVFKTINHFYHQNNLSFAYSKGLKSFNDYMIEEALTKEFTLQEIMAGSYRNLDNLPNFNLISFKASLFKQLQWTSLQNIDDHFWQSPLDYVLWEPLLEKSCKKKQLIPQFFYLTYQGLGNLDKEDQIPSTKDSSHTYFKKDPSICLEK